MDTSKQNWEKDSLKREQVKKGLRNKRAVGAISQDDFDAITNALAIPASPKIEVAKSYRNGLLHHVRPSVDYRMFYPYLDSRTSGIISANGPPVQYRFAELHAAFSEYLDSVVSMLQKLSELEILRRRQLAG